MVTIFISVKLFTPNNKNTLTHIRVTIFSIHKIFLHTSIRIFIILFVFEYMLLYFSDRLQSQKR